MAPSKLWLDLETYSETPIKNGTYRYAEDAEIMLFAYAVDDEPAEVVDFTANEHLPRYVLDLLMDSDREIWAQNSMFDRTVLRYSGFGTHIERWRDTMIQAIEHALPGSLGALCDILRVPQSQAKKDREGKLIHLFCKPRPKNMKLRRATRLTHPKEWEEFKEYARNDIEAMREVHKRLPQKNYPKGGELTLWHLDQKVNDRGFCVDRKLVDGALMATAKEKASLKEQTFDLTDGEVNNATQRDALLKYLLEAEGVMLADLKKDTLQRALAEGSLSEHVSELLRIRLAATSTSTSKYVSLQKAINDDGRCRGTIQFCGAKRTGRAAGRTFQPQNLPSRGLLKDYETEFGIELLRNGIAPGFLYPEPMRLMVSAVRGVLVASRGHKLVVADLANIEGRYAAWIASEEWKLKAFEDYDNGTGEDLYKIAYARSFGGEPSDVGDSSPERQIGKVQELMLQYQGGVGAFLTGAETYGFDIDKLAEGIYDTLPAREVNESEDFWDWCHKQKISTYGLAKKSFITCDVLKRLWRKSNSKITAFWPALEDAVRRAVLEPGTIFRCGEHIQIMRRRNYLYVRLPSGRCLTYPAPQLEGKQNKITFMGEHPYTRRWQRLSTYGGKLFENICQAGSRDVLYAAQQPAEDVGFKIVLHVHDELVTEAPLENKELTLSKLCNILATNPPWAVGLPLSAAGFEGNRYRK